MSTTARKAWLKLLRTVGVKHFRATSGLGLPYICYVGDEAGEAHFYNLKSCLPELAVMSAWCRDIESPVIFDIGANNGFIATQLAQLLRKNDSRIYAVEPVPSTFAQLKKSIDLLALSDHVTPICAAVSDSAGVSQISYDPRKSLYAQITNGASNPRAGFATASAQTVTIDQMVKSLGVQPHLLKIDIEGNEEQALRGAAQLLANPDPPAVCLEWNPLTLSERGGSALEMVNCLSNYSFNYIDDFEGQRKMFGEQVPQLSDIDWVCNVFGVPRNRAIAFEAIKNHTVAAFAQSDAK